jgi:hypothetical protein
MIASDQVFKGTKVFLDGGSFTRCRFERCEIIINGYLGCNLVDPLFVDCRWTVNGPAQTTFQLLAALYSAGAVDLVEATFDQIRGRQTADQSA